MFSRLNAGARFAVIGACAAAALGFGGYFAVRWHVRASAPLTLEQAERALRERNNAQVRETLKWLLWFAPREDRALLIAGVSLNADRRFPEAIALLERIPDASDSFEQGGIALAASLIHDGQLERAEIVLKRVLARFPGSADARDRLVRLYLQELRKRDAQALLIDRLRLFPDDLSVLPDLLELEVKPVTPHERIGALEMADVRHPHQAPVVLALARAYALMGRTEPARERFRAALELRPDDPEARISAAEFFLDAGESDAARSLLPTDATTEAGDDRNWFSRCRLAELAGDASEAYHHVEQALSLRPHDETYVLKRAALLRQLGRGEDAVQAARRAAELADVRRQLLILSNNLDRQRPDPADCLAIADLMQSLGHPQQAADWRRVGSAAASPTRNY